MSIYSLTGQEKILELICTNKKIYKVQPSPLRKSCIDLNSSLSSDDTQYDMTDDITCWPVDSTTYQYICQQCKEWQSSRNHSNSEVHVMIILFMYEHYSTIFKIFLVMYLFSLNK